MKIIVPIVAKVQLWLTGVCFPFRHPCDLFSSSDLDVQKMSITVRNGCFARHLGNLSAFLQNWDKFACFRLEADVSCTEPENPETVRITPGLCIISRKSVGISINKFTVRFQSLLIPALKCYQWVALQSHGSTSSCVFPSATRILRDFRRMVHSIRGWKRRHPRQAIFSTYGLGTNETKHGRLAAFGRKVRFHKTFVAPT